MCIAQLTLEELIEKHSLLKPNTNCLLDIACPKCGNRDNFGIVGKCEFDVEDDGSSGNESDHEWDERAHTRCKECGHEGSLATFTFDGLDEKLEELLNE